MFARIAVACCVWFTCIVSARAAEPPKLDQLIARLPVLSADSEQLKSCELRVVVTDLFPPAFRAHVGWDRTFGREARGAVFSDPVARVPILVFAKGNAFIYDAVGRRGITMTECWPNLRLRIDKENQKLLANFGFVGPETFKESNDLFNIDPASLLLECQTPHWREIDENIWESTSLSPTGKTTLTCRFELLRDYPLTTMSVHSAPQSELIYELEVISTNQPISKKLLTFPKENQLTEMIPFVTFKEASNGNAQDALDMMFRIFFAHRAMRDPKIRKELWFLKDVDWDVVERNYAEASPALLKLAPDLRSDEER